MVRLVVSLRRVAFVAATALPIATVAYAAPPDIVALIECRSDLQGFGALAFPLMEGNEILDALGWKERPGSNPLLREFDLAAPITAFAHPASRVAVTQNAVLAIFEGMSRQALAAELGVVPSVDSGDKFLGEKVIFQDSQSEAGIRYDTRIALNVSTVDTHPQSTFAGCSYALDMADE